MIEETNLQTTLSNFLRTVKIGQENALDIVKETLPDGKEKITLAVQNRVCQPEDPKPLPRAESPKRAHQFFSIDGFVKFIEKYKTQNTVVLADFDERQIECVLDDKAEKGFEVVTFLPSFHPLFAPWRERIIGQTIDLKSFVKFLVANKKAVINPQAEALTMLFSQVRASSNITVHKGIGNRSLNGVTCQIEIMGKKENQEVELPNALSISVPIFMDTQKAFIDIDLLLEVREQTGIMVACSSADVDVAIVQALEQYVAKIQAIDGVVASLGSVKTEPWEYIQNRMIR